MCMPVTTREHGNFYHTDATSTSPEPPATTSPHDQQSSSGVYVGGRQAVTNDGLSPKTENSHRRLIPARYLITTMLGISDTSEAACAASLTPTGHGQVGSRQPGHCHECSREEVQEELHLVWSAEFKLDPSYLRIPSGGQEAPSTVQLLHRSVFLQAPCMSCSCWSTHEAA